MKKIIRYCKNLSYFVVFCLVGIGLPPAGSVYAQETIQLHTYYPSPNGVYNELNVARRMAIGDTNGDGIVNSADLTGVELAVRGDAEIFGNLGVGGVIYDPDRSPGQITIDSYLLVNYNAVVARDLGVGGDARIVGNLQVWKDATIAGNLRVWRDATITRDVWVGRHARITRVLLVGDDARIGDDLTVSDDATIGDNLYVRGNSYTSGRISGGRTNTQLISAWGWPSITYSARVVTTALASAAIVRELIRIISSVRYKENIKTIDNALDKVTRLRGVEFDWKEGGKHDIGLIAEEVGEVVPEVVVWEEGGEYAESLNYANLVGLLVEAVKEQQTQIDNLEKKVEELKR